MSATIAVLGIMIVFGVTLIAWIIDSVKSQQREQQIRLDKWWEEQWKHAQRVVEREKQMCEMFGNDWKQQIEKNKCSCCKEKEDKRKAGVW